jgi:hypothetical protein
VYWPGNHDRDPGPPAHRIRSFTDLECLHLHSLHDALHYQPVPAREKGDRPEVVPKGSTNLAFTGQFCELPDDVVFTVEYSIRSAQTAVYDLLGLNRKPPAVYKGQYDPRVLYKAFTTLHDMKA